MLQPPPVARVNGNPIGRQTLELIIEEVRSQYTKSGRELTTTVEVEIRQEALKQLVGQELLFQESQRRGCVIDEEAVEYELGDMAQQVGGILPLTIILARRGMQIEDVRTGLRRDRFIAALVDEEVSPQVFIPENEARTFYDSYRHLFRLDECPRVSHISIRLSKDAQPGEVAAVQEKLGRYRDRMVAGEAVTTLVDEVAGDDQVEAGELGPVGRGSLPAELDRALTGMEVGAVSEVVRSSTGVHVLTVIGREPARELDFPEVLPRIKKHLEGLQRANLVEELTEQLREGATIELVED